MGYGSYHGVPPPVHAKWNMRVSVPVFLLGSLLIQVTLLRELGGGAFHSQGAGASGSPGSAQIHHEDGVSLLSLGWVRQPVAPPEDMRF